HDRQLHLITAPLEALDETMLRPDVVGELSATLDLAAQPQIIAINLLGLLVMSLLHQQARERMPWGAHPGPGLDVLEIIVAAEALPRVLVGLLVIAEGILELAVKHLF